MKYFFPKKILTLIISICIAAISFAQNNTEYDIVLTGGRVIDPETKLDAIKNVGISDHKIAIISSKILKGKQVINVSGLVVAPGFIDMHIHGRTNTEQEYQLHDGITTALELEWGIEYTKQWYASRKGKALINYGASVSWPFERLKAIDRYKNELVQFDQKIKTEGSSIEKLMVAVLPAADDQITDDEINKTVQNIKSSLEEGGIGIGAPIGYLPKTNPKELYKIFQQAGEWNALVFTHTRGGGIISVEEVINDAMLTNAPLHIVHINSSSLGNIQFAIDMINTARKKGFDISTELYPYTAGSTSIQSAVFNEGWQENNAISYKDLQWVNTGERLTKETFEAYRKIGGMVIMHMMKPEWIKAGIAAPGVMIASDGMQYAPLAHPRTAGTFSRVLGKYVREENVIDLNTAIEKMTLLPAKRLENIAPAMQHKGRLQVGADADITVFNPNTIIDKATFEKGLTFSEGVAYVIVNGAIVLKNGKTVDGVFQGQPIYGKFKKGD